MNRAQKKLIIETISGLLDRGEVARARQLFDAHMPNAIGNLRNRLEAAELKASEA